MSTDKYKEGTKLRLKYRNGFEELYWSVGNIHTLKRDTVDTNRIKVYYDGVCIGWFFEENIDKWYRPCTVIKHRRKK